MSDTTAISDEINARLALGAHDPYQFVVATLMMIAATSQRDLDAEWELTNVLNAAIDQWGLTPSVVTAAQDEVIAVFATLGYPLERFPGRDGDGR